MAAPTTTRVTPAVKAAGAAVTTASFTPSGPCYLSIKAAGTQGTGPVVISNSLGLTQTNTQTRAISAPGFPTSMISTVIKVTSPAAMTITADATTGHFDRVQLVVDQIDGADGTTPIGATANSAGSPDPPTQNNAWSITLNATPASDSLIEAETASTCSNSVPGTPVPGSGWTEGFDLPYDDYQSFEGQYRTGLTSTTVPWTSTFSTGQDGPYGSQGGLAREWLAAAGSGNSIAVPAGSLTLTGQTPTVTATANNFIAIPLATMTLVAQTPTVAVGGNQSVSIPAGSLTLNGFAPSVTATANNAIAVPAGSLTLTGNAPTVTATAGQYISVPVGSLTINGLIPTVALSDNQFVQVPAGALSLTGIAPAVQAGGPQVIDVPLGALTITVYAPTVIASQPPDATASGGYGFWPDFEYHQRARRKRQQELEEAEEQAKLVQDELDRQIFLAQRKLEAEEAERADLARLQALADQYASKVDDLPKPVAVALWNAQDARTRNALEQLRRMVEQMLDDELIAIQQVVLLMTD
jgi:hypothetical protein